MARPDWAPETAWDPQKGLNQEVFAKHWTDQVAPQLTAWAAEQVRRNALPQKADEVKLELPKEFQLPQGVEFSLDPSKPEFAKFRELAVKRGLDQDTVTDLMGVYAETLVGDAAAIQTARNAEIGKLGANGPARVTALNTFFGGLLGEAGGKEIQKMMVTEGIIRSLETVVAKFSSQGSASFSQAHRDPAPAGGRVSQEVYDKMGPAARLDYARQFDQSQFQKPNGAAA